MALRHARISWSAVANAKGYAIHRAGTKSGIIADEFSAGITVLAPTTHFDIDLDEYLADATDDTFRVVALGRANSHADSDFSAAIKIIDNPITRADGDSRGLTTGKAEITWAVPSTATSLEIRYRNVGSNHNNTDLASGLCRQYGRLDRSRSRPGG